MGWIVGSTGNFLGKKIVKMKGGWVKRHWESAGLCYGVDCWKYWILFRGKILKSKKQELNINKNTNQIFPKEKKNT